MGERLGRKHRPGAKNTGVSGKRAGPPPPSVPAVGKEEGAAGDRGGKWRREPSSRGAPRPRQKWRLFVLTEVREGGRTRRPESVCREQQTCRRAAERRTEAPRSSAREPAGTAGRGPAGRGPVGLDDPLPPRLNLSPSSIFEKLGKERKRKGNCSHGKGG